ncbi:MAG TPA: ABC transporter substrate-binding protein, partial [Clostridia bacterium]|nr:ABC transporter substrate-binding protein [Clostridia bacterium]
YMGVKNLPYISAKLIENGMRADMPAALAKMQEFIQAGVVDPEIFSTQTEQILAAKAFQNQVGMVYIGWSGFAKNEHIEQMKAGNPNAEWAQLPAMEGLYGAVDGRYEAATTNHMFALPASLPKNPDKLSKVFELVNYVSSPEGSNV